MKIKDNYVLQKIVDEYIVVPIAQEADRINGVFNLNETGAFIWQVLEKGTMTHDELVEALYLKYNEDRFIIEEDVNEFLEQLELFGCLEK